MSTLNNGLLWFQDVNRLVGFFDGFFFIPYTGFDFAFCSLQVFRKSATSASLKDKAQYLKSSHFTRMMFFSFLDKKITLRKITFHTMYKKAEVVKILILKDSDFSYFHEMSGGIHNEHSV